ncbi:hypothetical protein AOQ84DRAFT_442428 [Glonium stellatum]|uniref:Zn(2)-C6 fungal-type domain-containing protein n=1 Tax=Glonium stellatum TaxID=574774 RepID=A0A8E2ES71_9PEZI|nr:hypothetical protein AOQ84DRAFT_442428 [Glonium stellatum]
MVGVPGHSKGCQTCKKRKIKCDERRPTCQRCEKSGYSCGGYERPIPFHNTSIAPFNLVEENKPSISQHSFPNCMTRIVPRIRNPAPNELSLVAFKGDMCFAFLFENFVWRSYGTPWLQMAASGKLDSLALESSQALSQANFGSSHRLPDIQINGAIQYGKALRALIPGLSDPSKPGVEILLVPIMILLIHATSQADQEGSISHVKGLAMLLHVCGPERFQREPLRGAFESCRATLVTAGLVARQRTFLEQEKWQTIPWALGPPSKSQQNHLVDILAMVPGFLEDDAKLGQLEDLVLRQDLLCRLKCQLQRLYRWRWKWEELNPNAAQEETPSTPLTNKPRVVEKTLYFSAHLQATEIMLYNAVLLWLLGLLWRLEPLDGSTTVEAAAAAAADISIPVDVSAVTLHLPGQAISLRDPAIEICRVFEFQIANMENSKDSALFFLFPLGLAWSVLEQEAPFREWIRGMLDSSRVTRGYAIGQNLWGFGNYNIPKVFQ